MVYRSRFYKHSQRGYFHKRRWAAGGDLLTMKISGMHRAFHIRHGRMASAGWDGKTGTGLMHVFDLHDDRVVQIRVIVKGYIYRIYRGKQADEFDRLWYKRTEQFPNMVELVREYEQGRVAESG